MPFGALEVANFYLKLKLVLLDERVLCLDMAHAEAKW